MFSQVLHAQPQPQLQLQPQPHSQYSGPTLVLGGSDATKIVQVLSDSHIQANYNQLQRVQPICGCQYRCGVRTTTSLDPGDMTITVRL